MIGSSPRGRGKPIGRFWRIVGPRLIPAWAGKTCTAALRAPAHRAHPRVGGENGHPERRVLWKVGSSPRGRGKLSWNRCWKRARRLIPAWAGKTNRRSSSTRCRWAHPRVGGENARSAAEAWMHAGSSPRGRGKPLPRPTKCLRRRLIPAWAGKTSSGVLAASIAAGSSPRGRGKPAGTLASELRRRLIPAWAGKTPYSARPSI